MRWNLSESHFASGRSPAAHANWKDSRKVGICQRMELDARPQTALLPRNLDRGARGTHRPRRGEVARDSTAARTFLFGRILLVSGGYCAFFAADNVVCVFRSSVREQENFGAGQCGCFCDLFCKTHVRPRTKMLRHERTENVLKLQFFCFSCVCIQGVLFHNFKVGSQPLNNGGTCVFDNRACILHCECEFRHKPLNNDQMPVTGQP